MLEYINPLDQTILQSFLQDDQPHKIFLTTVTSHVATGSLKKAISKRSHECHCLQRGAPHFLTSANNNSEEISL